jgi:peptide deformylase
LAAVQVGVPARVFVVDVTGHPRANSCHGLFALCNAAVVAGSQWRAGREGCLSVPDLTGDVRRAGRLVVVGQAPGTGEQVEIRADAFEARALQHELDHCAGLLFLDRVAGANAVHPRKVYL